MILTGTGSARVTNSLPPADFGAGLAQLWKGNAINSRTEELGGQGARSAYDYGTQRQTLQNQLLGIGRDLDSQTYQAQLGQNQNQINRYNMDIDLNRRLNESLGGDIGRYRANIGSYGQDRGTLAQQLANTISGYNSAADTSQRENYNKAAGAGSFFGQGRLNTKRDIITDLSQKTLGANLTNEMAQRDLDRAIRGQEGQIAGTERSIWGNDTESNKLRSQISDAELEKQLTGANFNASMAKYGIQSQLGDVELKNLKTTLDQRLNELNLSNVVSTNRLLGDVLGNASGAGGDALRLLQQIAPEYFGG